MPSLHSLFSLSLSSLYTLYPLDLPRVLSLALLPFFTPCPSLSLVLSLVLPHVLSLALLPFFLLHALTSSCSFSCPPSIMYSVFPHTLLHTFTFLPYVFHLALPTSILDACPLTLQALSHSFTPSLLCTPGSLSLLYSLLPSLPAALPVAVSPAILLFLRNLKNICLINNVIKP